MNKLKNKISKKKCDVADNKISDYDLNCKMIGLNFSRYGYKVSKIEKEQKMMMDVFFYFVKDNDHKETTNSFSLLNFKWMYSFFTFSD